MSIETKKGPIGFATWAACGFGLGFAPMAPGSVATLFMVFLVGALRTTLESEGLLAIVILVMIVVGIPLCNAAEKQLGHDAQSIVWDEFIGFGVALWYLPALSWGAIVGAFFAFRFFDILKPFPVNRVEKLPRAWGVIGDDVLAGVYANLVVQGVMRFLI
ncbi:phosphatidylglycerophosphatase A [Gemmatimonadota bacterium]